MPTRAMSCVSGCCASVQTVSAVPRGAAGPKRVAQAETHRLFYAAACSGPDHRRQRWLTVARLQRSGMWQPAGAAHIRWRHGTATLATPRTLAALAIWRRCGICGPAASVATRCGGEWESGRPAAAIAQVAVAAMAQCWPAASGNSEAIAFLPGSVWTCSGDLVRLAAHAGCWRAGAAPD